MDLLAWLLDSDPAIRHQVMRDLTDAPADEVAAERARIATEGWAARLLALRDPDGLWAHGACFPNTADLHRPRPPASPVATAQQIGDDTRALSDGSAEVGLVAADPLPDDLPPGDDHDDDGQPWTATYPTLDLLLELGVDPDDPRIRETIDLIAVNCLWEEGGQPFFAGEVEPCINGHTLRIAHYFGHAEHAADIADRLLGEQLDDGGWNCEAENGSTHSSFHSTICVLRGLLAHERATGDERVREARRTGEEYLLERHLMRRRSTGAIVDPDWLQLSFPTQWHYDVLHALEHFRDAGGEPDPRLAEALQLVADKRQPDGRWLLENTHPGDVHFALEDGDGRPSRWNTLRSMRVLRWADGAASGPR